MGEEGVRGVGGKKGEEVATPLHCVSRGDAPNCYHHYIQYCQACVARTLQDFFFSQYLNQLSEGKHGQKTGMVAHEIIFPIVFNLGRKCQINLRLSSGQIGTDMSIIKTSSLIESRQKS